MASHFEDATQWRLRTNGGIPYKMVSLTGSLEEIKGEANVRLLIRGSDLIAFAQEVFPGPLQFGAVSIPRYARYANTNLCVTRVGFKSFDDALPIDPFSFDLLATPGTYYKILELDLTLATPPRAQTTDPSNPFTFLEISAEVGGEFIRTETGGKETWVDVDTNGNPTGNPEKNRRPTLPHTIFDPRTIWSVSWKKIPFDIFRDTIRGRIDTALGKVNSKAFSLLYSTAPETLLFLGYTYKYNFTWKDGSIDKPFIDLDMKFSEKRIDWRGKVYGHNDFWKPGLGWRRLFIDGQPTYDKTDYNNLFKP